MRGSEKIHAVDGVTLEINQGDIVSVIGESGSGKTTLVNLIGCLDNPTSGELILMGNKFLHKELSLVKAN